MKPTITRLCPRNGRPCHGRLIEHAGFFLGIPSEHARIFATEVGEGTPGAVARCENLCLGQPKPSLSFRVKTWHHATISLLSYPRCLRENVEHVDDFGRRCLSNDRRGIHIHGGMDAHVFMFFYVSPASQVKSSLRLGHLGCKSLFYLSAPRIRIAFATKQRSKHLSRLVILSSLLLFAELVGGPKDQDCAEMTAKRDT